mgnify:CR=1 FL=1
MPIMQGDKKVANVYNINNNSYSVPIGCIIPFSGSTIPVGFLLCDGSEVSKTDYADLYAVIADLYGTCTDTTKFKLPDPRDKFVQGANGNLGTSKTAGLPNITGKFYHDTNAKAGLSGAFTYEGTGRQNLMNDSPTNSGLITFDASKSNPIYGNSDTVQPPSICLTFIIKAEKVSDQYAAEVGALIDDSSTATNKVWSSQKVSNNCVPMKAFDLNADIDLNDYTTTGYYFTDANFETSTFAHSLINYPYDDAPLGGFGLEVHSYGTHWCTQTLYIYATVDADIWTRTKYYINYKETWGDWERVTKYSKTLTINQSFTANTWNVVDTGTETNWWAENVVAVFKSAFYSSSGTQVFGVIRVNATTGKLEFRPEANCDFVVIHKITY